MASTLRSTASYSGLDQNFVINLPAGTEDGDLMVMSYSSSNHDDPVATLAGWTQIEAVGYSTSVTLGIVLFYKVASGEPSSYTWAQNATRGCNAKMASFYDDSGEGTWGLEASSGAEGTGNSLATASVTTLDNSLLLANWGYDREMLPVAPPSGMTAFGAVQQDQSGTHACYYEVVATGAATSKTLTWVTSDQMVAIAAVFSFTASAGGGGPTLTAAGSIKATTAVNGITPIGGLSGSIIGVSTNPVGKVFSEDQSADHTSQTIGGLNTGGVEGVDFEAVVGASINNAGKHVRYETATAPTAPDAAFPNTYLNKTSPAKTVDTDESTFSVEP
jgi:hypothetical protein